MANFGQGFDNKPPPPSRDMEPVHEIAESFEQFAGDQGAAEYAEIEPGIEVQQSHPDALNPAGSDGAYGPFRTPTSLAQTFLRRALLALRFPASFPRVVRPARSLSYPAGCRFGFVATALWNSFTAATARYRMATRNICLPYDLVRANERRHHNVKNCGATAWQIGPAGVAPCRPQLPANFIWLVVAPERLMKLL